MVALIGRADTCEFWRIGDDVFRAPLGTSLDITGRPLGRRWECSVRHWDIYRTTAYAWVVVA